MTPSVDYAFGLTSLFFLLPSLSFLSSAPSVFFFFLFSERGSFERKMIETKPNQRWQLSVRDFEVRNGSKKMFPVAATGLLLLLLLLLFSFVLFLSLPKANDREQRKGNAEQKGNKTLKRGSMSFGASFRVLGGGFCHFRR